MDRETLDSLDKETLIRLILSQAEAIERLTREVEALRADNATLRAKRNLPSKTPENSSTPPSQGHKAAGEESKTFERKRRKPHAGAHRPLHLNPSAKRDVFAGSCQQCGAFFLDPPQFVCEAYDHIEIAPIVPHVTRVSLLGGSLPVLRQDIQGAAAARHAERLALWPKLARPRHLPALHPRHRVRALGYSPVRSPLERGPTDGGKTLNAVITIYVLEHLGPPLESWWRDLGDITLDEELNGAIERWLGKFEQRAKWNFCLTAAMVAADQERR